MNGFIRLMAIGCCVLVLANCASRSSSEDELILGDGNSSEESEQQAPQDDASASTSSGEEDFEEFSDSPVEQAPPAEVVETPPPAEPPPAEVVETPPAIAETPPPTEPPPTEAPVEITALKFKANDNGGTIVIEGSGPLNYTTRSNPDLKQFIVEVPNSILPAKLTRNLNTRDMQGFIGSVDAYQNPGSNTSRFVIQLRDGSPEPAVQAEGRTLLIVATGGSVTPTPEEVAAAPKVDSNNGLNTNLSDEKILTSQSLQEFLSGNQRFYGHPISVEVDNIEVKKALQFIANESGLNMIISDDVTGKVSLKLQNVPWDQALVIIMRAKKLGYSRQGSVIRIASLKELKDEEKDANEMAASKRIVEPLKVRIYPVSYAKVDDLSRNLKEFLSERGKIAADTRTASLIVTDIEENLEKVGKLVTSLDIQPPQVMIEGKIVEASENFQRQIGVSWGFSGQEFKVGNQRGTPINLTPVLSVAPGGAVSATQGVGMGFGMRLGVLDFLGDIDANLRLNEAESKIKIISSPRVVTLTNELAKINQTTEIPYTTTSFVQGVGARQEVSFKPLKLELGVTPQVTADGSVLMKVNLVREIQTPGVSSSGVFGTSSRTADTKILIKNGQTAVIGGIYQSDATEAEDRVPGLGSIPFLGRLFKGDRQTRQKLELLIFLTPRILDSGMTGSSKGI